LDVSNNTALTELWCRNNQLTSLDVRNNTALTELYCGDNNFRDKSAIIGLNESQLTNFYWR
jgi:Leucine-rich repeat (LRR) protein